MLSPFSERSKLVLGSSSIHIPTVPTTGFLCTLRREYEKEIKGYEHV